VLVLMLACAAAVNAQRVSVAWTSCIVVWLTCSARSRKEPGGRVKAPVPRSGGAELWS